MTRDLLEIMSPAFREFRRKHDAALDAWERAQKALISEQAAFLSRSLGQKFRRARINLIAASDAMPAQGDPDFMPIIQAKVNRQNSTALHAISSREALLRLVSDQPFTLKGQFR